MNPHNWMLPGAPWDLESIVRKCLAPNPADRYQQAEHLADDLQRFLEDRLIHRADHVERALRDVFELIVEDSLTAV